MTDVKRLLDEATPRDRMQELVDAAFPTGGTEGPNAWTEQRIYERTRFAREAERIMADYEAAVDALAHFLTPGHAAGWRDCHELERARAALARLREQVPA